MTLVFYLAAQSGHLVRGVVEVYLLRGRRKTQSETVIN